MTDSLRQSPVPPLTGHPRLAPWLDHDRINRAFAAQHQSDPLGWRIHLALGMLWCFLASSPTSIVEFAGIPVVLCFFIRLPKIWRTARWIFAQPLFFALLAWAAWQAISLAWSPDPIQGLDEMANMRWAGAMLVLWPVIDGRKWLIAALAAGFVAGNLSQLGHAIGTAAQIDWLTFDRLPHRNSGWWDPVIGGTLLVAALGLHIPAALMGLGRTRIIATSGCAITLIAILATGTRGAWLAAAALLALSTIIAIVCIQPRRRLLVPLITGSATIIIASAIAWMTAGDSISARFNEARTEITTALNDDNYQTYTGARIMMAKAAAQAISAHPIRGVGAGGYRQWSLSESTFPDSAQINLAIHNHAHNAYLHIGATTGIIGLLLGATILLVVFTGAILAPEFQLGTYEAGPLFALLGLLLVAMFDTIHVNAQTAAMLFLIFALCPLAIPHSKSQSQMPDA